MKKRILCFLIAVTMILLPVGVLGVPADSDDGVWVVKFKPNISRASTQSVSASQDLDNLGQTESQYFTTEDPEVAEEMKESGLCEYVEEVGYSYASTAPNDPFYSKKTEDAVPASYQYALEMLSAESAWGETLGDSSVDVVVIDSGFDYSHEDGANIHAGYDYITESTNTKDYGTHGTSCAGIIGATYNNGVGIAGAAPNSDITMLRCFVVDRLGNTTANNAHIAAAIRDAVDVHHADIISMSFGSTKNDTVLKEAVDYAYNKGAIMVAAVGNKGEGSSPLEYPAAYDKVIGVGSVGTEVKTEAETKFYKEEVSYFSSRNKSVYVMAPGYSILMLKPGQQYAADNGTSFAAPYVASLAALARSINPNISALEFRSLLRLTCKDLGAAGYDYTYGYGLINYENFIYKMKNKPFIDVPDKQWYTDAVYNLKSQGIISGRTTYTFCPNDMVKRGEFVTLLATASKDELSGFHYQGQFKDVKKNDWYNPYVNWAFNKGVASGKSKTEFYPKAFISRQEMAAMLNRYLTVSGIPVIEKIPNMAFTDAKTIAPWAEADVNTLAKAQIINGFEDNTFRPLENSTRAQAAILLNQVIK